MRKSYSIVLGLFLLLLGCNDDFTNDQSIDNELIINYIAQNNIEAYHYSDGLYYNTITNEIQSNNYPNPTSTIEVKYTGYLIDGTVIDSSNNKFISVSLTECIEGWQLGIPLLTENSKGMLFIPSNLAYGEFATNSIPPHSVIIYEIELKGFHN